MWDSCGFWDILTFAKKKGENLYPKSPLKLPVYNMKFKIKKDFDKKSCFFLSSADGYIFWQ